MTRSLALALALISSFVCVRACSSSGEVYRGFSKQDGSEVAIKVLDVGPKEKLGSIENEIRMMKESKHPNVVAHKGTYLKDEKLWVAMEFMDGGALTEVISVCQMTEPQIAAVCREVWLNTHSALLACLLACLLTTNDAWRRF